VSRVKTVRACQHPIPEGEGERQGGLLPEAADDEQRLADDDLAEVRAARWPEGLVNLLKVQEAAFRRSGLSADAAFTLAKAGIVEMARYYGGRQWYLPRGDDLHTALRDAEIYRRANRDTMDALADEYGLTPRSVSRIVRRQRRLHLDKVQGRLPFKEFPMSATGT